jgi:hypothetical protein
MNPKFFVKNPGPGLRAAVVAGWVFLALSAGPWVRHGLGAEPGADVDLCKAQLLTLESQLTVAHIKAQNWANIWGATWGAATVAQLAVAGTAKSLSTRQDLFVGAASSALGLIPTWIFPPAITGYESPSSATGFVATNACRDLSALEARLSRYVADDENNTGVLAHASNLAVNLAVSLVMGAGFGHWHSASVSAIVGIPIGELMILTYPRTASHFEEQRVHIAWVADGGSQALALTYRF